MDKHHYYRDTWAEIDLDKISQNIKSFKRHLPEQKIMAVVKANGYGHGALQVAEEALRSGAEFLAVAMLDEGLALRKQGIKAPILVMNRVRPEYASLAAENEISLTVFQKEWLMEAQSYMKETKHQIKIHLKIDTGMGRVGFREESELQEVASFINQSPVFEAEGVFTHFATADEWESELFEQQRKKFIEYIDLLKSWGLNPPLVHSANSAAALRKVEGPFNLVRLGISMYGLAPSNELKQDLPFPLEEAFSLHSRLIHVKKLMPGDTVSYGATYTATKEEWVGTLPIGYADGWQRRLSPGASVLINGERMPIIGRICMDQCMVRLPKRIDVGEVATLIGSQQAEKIEMDEIARIAETINYEIPCLISARVPRVYTKKGRILENMNVILNF
ncbi:alanine racemase [Fictibacillus phosphorivorans]|uniref:Alanine racemase n=1 Tax=Fictibacillus phosphorivorans TaxID=1221500 RepID=A0A168VQH3_9BACL|nr:alanine racemase [Fictibacillus phosphorivorans]ANC75549.1 alanine racemase [Fictibacillus phosphorivorans]